MWGWKDVLKLEIERAVKSANERSNKELADMMGKYPRVLDLEKKLVELQIQQDRKTEEWARKEREIEHKVGLEKARHDMEVAASKKDIDVAKRESALSVREENLAADKQRFKEEMEFQRKQLESQVTGLQELVQKMLERLPSAKIYADLTNVKGGRKK